jgi:[acyl-carrier-protein] S-malonyltransferase
MQPALQPVREAIARIEFREPRFVLVPNVSARPTTNTLVLRDLLARHLVSPVKWESSIRAMSDLGVTWFLEAGPGDVLGKLARRAVPGATVREVGSPDEAVAAAAELHQADEAGQGENS